MPKTSSSVHNIETSGRKRIHSSYQAYNTSFIPAEWSAVRETYEKMDVAGSISRRELLDDCRQIAWFVRNSETGKVRVSANHCHLRWCPLCANAKKSYIAHNLQNWLNYADHPKMLTLTMLHSDAPLEHQVKHLYDSFRSLRRTKLFRATVTGGVWFFQIKFNESSNQWHPHIHALITGRYLPQGKLSRLWLKITHTSTIVDIRSVHDIEKASFELSRYCARPSNVREIPKVCRTELFSAMHGRRLCGTWGTGRALSLSQPRERDTGKWVRLCRWSTLRENLDTDPDAQAILKAWQTNEVLSPDITLIEQDDFLDGTPEEIEPEPPPVYLFKGFS